MTDRLPQCGFRVLDLSALVVGYSLAALLVRAFWPSPSFLTTVVLVVISIVFLWLGLAMSGPLVLARRRRATDPTARTQSHYTWAEVAWLIIGFYWIAMMVVLVPVRMHNAKLLDAGFIGVFPFLAALALRFLSPKGRAVTELDSHRRWTHRAAVGLLITWPFVWVALIMLGMTLP